MSSLAAFVVSAWSQACSLFVKLHIPNLTGIFQCGENEVACRILGWHLLVDKFLGFSI